MLALHGIGVLVTRPSHQAVPLCRLLEIQGARALRFAAIEIRPLAERRALAARLGALERFAVIIFSSANAVRYGAALLEQRRDLTLAAIGPATARALNQAGYRVSVSTSGGADSESLLTHPKLCAVAGERILLVKGSQGRDLLERELTRRGAAVTLAEVYRRERAVPSAAELAVLEAHFASREIQVITATSAEIAASLLALATPALRAGFEAAHWLVPSMRVSAALRAAGLQAGLILAPSAQDQDLVAALLRWRASESGA
ncbi:MAG TPA: uroporphyrinogen-III synthase [Steroidobacteraceae bacterium]|nr:uroporphyrinogen-III synthase [Steroidobacteraceae bacterium]